MRLIDADKLKRTTGIFQYQIKDAFDRLASGYKSEDVENAPTVEAIPVEWVNQFVIDTCKSSHDDSLPAFLYWLDKMVAKWRKENE